MNKTQAILTERKLPKISSYGNYSSGNYGAHCLCVEMPNATVWFSYETPVAFQINGSSRVVRRNDWGPTTGKHLNAIDDGDKKARVDGETFERLFVEQFEKAKS